MTLLRASFWRSVLPGLSLSAVFPPIHVPQPRQLPSCSLMGMSPSGYLPGLGNCAKPWVFLSTDATPWWSEGWLAWGVCLHIHADSLGTGWQDCKPLWVGSVYGNHQLLVPIVMQTHGKRRKLFLVWHNAFQEESQQSPKSRASTLESRELGLGPQTYNRASLRVSL